MLGKLNPAQTLVAGFSVIILIGSILLSLPIAVSNGEVNFLTSFFTATSALCVTGLVLVDTGTHWTAFGQAFPDWRTGHYVFCCFSGFYPGTENQFERAPDYAVFLE
jgi:Trk-type K+ transport system membrane component